MIQISKHPDRRWLVLRTRARAEKSVARYCERLPVPCYLPLQVRRQSRPDLLSHVPLFPGYVFAQISTVEQDRLAQYGHVAGIIAPDARAEDTLIAELKEVQLLEQAELRGELVVKPQIVPGRPVRVERGPLRGLEGIVRRRDGGVRVTVNLELIGQCVSVELDIDELGVDC